MSTSLDTERIRRKYQALFDSNMIGIVISDLDEQILEANDMFLNIIGYTKADLREGKISWSAITPSKYDEIDQEKIHELLQCGAITPFEKEYTHKNDYQVPVLVGAALIHDNPPLSICFALDITEQKKLEKKKDEFIGTVSHELRTPLAVLKLHTELCKEEILKDAPKEEILAAISEIDGQINQLTTLITDLLNFARLDGDGNIFEKKLFDLRKSVGRTVENVHMMTKRDIIFHSPSEEIIVNGSQDRLMQVTLNLIMNAVQYSKAPTPIIVSIQKQDGTALVSIQDSGIGISKENIDHIFERRYRGDHAGAYAPDGAGIGLYISREIINHHHGTLSVESTPQKGSTFSYTLPLVTFKSFVKEEVSETPSSN